MSPFGLRLGAALAWAAASIPAALAQPQAPAPAVTVAPVTARDVSQTWEFIGRVEAVQAVDIRARVQGFLQEMSFQEGQDVTAGQPLYTIEPDAYQAALDAAKAQLAKAQATLEQAERNLTRAQQLSARGFEAQQQLEQQRANRDTAAADVQAAQASLRTAELNLSYTVIRSPIDGRIGKSALTKGNLVGPDSGVLASVVQLDPVRVVFSIDDRALVQAKMKSGGASQEEMNARFVPSIRLSDDTMYPDEGKIEFVNNQVDPATGTVPVRALFPNTQRLLLPGQFVTIVIRPEQSEKRPVVPVASVLQDKDGKYVLVVGPDNKVQQRRIVANRQSDQDWVVESGLSEGEQVVVDGVQKVQPGATVNPIAAQAPPSEDRPQQASK